MEKEILEKGMQKQDGQKQDSGKSSRGYKAKFVTILKNAVFLAGLLLICLLLTRLFERKYSYIRYGSFFQQAEDYDVLFFGTSHVLNGVFPMELWNDYGITSYNLATPGAEIATSYWIMENSLDYAKPKLVVLDISRIRKNEKMNKPEGLHKIFDCFPLTKTKCQMIYDLLCQDTGSSNFQEKYERRGEFVWNFLLYHNRWFELKEEDFQPEQNPEKGGYLYVDVAKKVDYKVIAKDNARVDNTLSQEYLCRFIEDCQSKGIDVLLTFLPFAANKRLQRDANSVYQIAEKYGVNYLNFMYVDDLLDYSTDFHDLTTRGGI